MSKRLFTAAAWSLCIWLTAPATAGDTSSVDCDAVGPTTLLSGSGIRIEVDGKDSGCNEAGDRYSFGNVIGAIRVYPGFPGVTGPEAEELLIDTPFEFTRVTSPLGSSILVGQWITRRGYTVFLTARNLGFRPGAGLQVNEFFVYEPGRLPLRDDAFYQEWNFVWGTAMPTRIFGRVQESMAGPEALGILDAEVSLFRCRAQDGLVGTVLTNGDGEYSFDVEEDGYYQMRVSPPAGFAPQAPRSGTDFRVLPNGFTACVDFRARPEAGRNPRTGGLFARDADRSVVLVLDRTN